MNRKQLKQQAKDVLRKDYWKIFILGIIVSILCLEFIEVSSNVTYSVDYSTSYTTYNLRIFMFDFVLQPSTLLIAIVSIGATASLIYGILFGDVIRYGYLNKLKYYALGKEYEFDLFDGFRKYYKNVVMVNLMAGIQIVLFTLLLVIPGIIKAYEYYYVNQVLEDHPDWNWREVLKESKRITNGHKKDIFILELSFILWRIVAGFIPSIGYYLLSPYTEMTYAYAYLYLKQLQNQSIETELFVNENMF